MNLMNILQSLDTSQFLTQGETVEQHAARLDQSVESIMNGIDNTFEEMDTAEKRLKMKKKANAFREFPKRKTGTKREKS